MSTLFKMQFNIGSKTIHDYTFSYTRLELSFENPFRFAFRRIGYLVFNLNTGTDYSCRFLNYNLSESTPNHLYITGLFSEDSLTTEQQGHGGGYAIKIHPVIGYHQLKIPLHELTNRQVQMSCLPGREGALLRRLESNDLIANLDHNGLPVFK